MQTNQHATISVTLEGATPLQLLWQQKSNKSTLKDGKHLPAHHKGKIFKYEWRRLNTGRK